MRTLKETMLSLTAMTVAMSAMVACGPPVNAHAQTGKPSDVEPASNAPLSSAAPPPPTEAECRVRASTLRAESSGPASDVQQQYDSFFLAHHETFRCCFDALYAPRMPRTDGQLALFVKLDASGKLTHSEIVANETTAQGQEVDACFLEVARMIAYPSPMSQESVGYKRIFQFKARR